MRTLTPAGQQLVQDIASRHGFGVDAVMSMLDAVVAGNGGMAQFNHPEFAGSGQWMRGGMIMVSDMFNNTLKGRIGALCDELSALVASQPGLLQTGSFQSQSQGGVGYASQSQGSGYGYPSQGGGYLSGGASQAQDASGPVGEASLFVPAPDWWGPDLRFPSSTGSQNHVRYAYFAQARRLAIELNGHVTVYDTLDHQIGGFSQQQSGTGSMIFSSQYGMVDVASLPVVSVDGLAAASPSVAPMPAAAEVAAMAATSVSAPSLPSGAGPASGGDVFAMIERLAELHAKGVLSADEFQQKKAELLSRL